MSYKELPSLHERVIIALEAVLESFFLQDHPKQIDAQWRQKTLITCEILGKPALRYLRPEIIGDRTRLDLMWNGKTLGIRGSTKPDGTYTFFALHNPDTVTPAIREMMSFVLSHPPPLQFAQFRFREGHGGIKGLWIDSSNEQIRDLLLEFTWLESLRTQGWLIEVGQKHKYIVSVEGALKLEPLPPRTWLPSYTLNNDEILLESHISLFSQPGPETNRALLAIGFELLDLMEVPNDLRWTEWGAGYGNLSSAYVQRLGPTGSCSEFDPAAGACLKLNAPRFFPTLATDLRPAEKGPQGDELNSDFWLIDPPRPGFGRLLEKLSGLAHRPEWILSYHCHPTGLIQDSKILKNSAYNLTSWSSVDAFPATPHHEVISLWKKG